MKVRELIKAVAGQLVKLITEATRFHIEGLRKAGAQQVPPPHSEGKLVDVTAA